jgi:hypothetical protein
MNTYRGRVEDDFSSGPENWSCCVATLAMMLDLSESRIQQFVRDGTFERRSDGTIGLKHAILNYERFLQKR